MIDLIDFMHADSSSSDTIARDRRFLPSWTLFAHRSLHLYHATRKTNDAGPDRIVDTFVPFNGLPDLLYEKERCDRNHHGLRWTTTVPVQEALSALLDGLTVKSNWGTRQKFDDMVGKKIILHLLTTSIHVANTPHR